MNWFAFASIVIMVASKLLFAREVIYEKHDSWPKCDWGESQDLSEDFCKRAFKALAVSDACCLRSVSLGKRFWNRELCITFYSIFKRGSQHLLHVYTRRFTRSETGNLISTFGPVMLIQDNLAFVRILSLVK